MLKKNKNPTDKRVKVHAQWFRGMAKSRGYVVGQTPVATLTLPLMNM